MGRRDRERRERIQAGLEKPHRNISVSRRAVALASQGQVKRELQQASTADQIEALDRTVGADSPSRLRKALVSKAPKEMDKAIKKFQRQGKGISVDILCSEIKSTPGFLSMCERVGLDLAWFENLARERMEANGL